AGIVRQLEGRARAGDLPQEAGDLLDAQLMETICLAHDLGHPPFGHGGEIALNYMMHDAGGFEGNGQTLRLLGRLEAHTPGYGLDLSRRTLLGVLKYPAPYSRVAP
ncbi:MAG: dGTPase, partial [Thiohalorhabdaceae bacterium]